MRGLARRWVPRKSGSSCFLRRPFHRQVSQLANESLSGYLRISCDASYDSLAGELILRRASLRQVRGSRHWVGIFCGKSTLFGMEPGRFWQAARSFHAPMALTIWHDAGSLKANSALIARVFAQQEVNPCTLSLHHHSNGVRDGTT